MQKIKFIPPFLRYCKLAFWGTLGMPGYDQQKRWYQLVGKFDVYRHAKNIIHPSPCSCIKILPTCYFGYFGHASPPPPKTTTLT